MFFRNCFFYIVGIFFLAMAKGKNIVKGYSSPKPFDISDTLRCIEYDFHVVEHWLSHLNSYIETAAPNNSLTNKNVLELGPGSDLGAGIYLLHKGCAQYNACDIHDLIKDTPDIFYQQLFERLEGGQTSVNLLRGELKKAKEKKPSRLNYVVRDDFDVVSAFGKSSIDLVFSQAAFEHFDDIEATIWQLSEVCKPQALMLAEVDLKTHSRWIRDRDPNNIYRYSNWVYKKFWFRGIPNRVRPYKYKELLESYGWGDISVTPLSKLLDHRTSYSGMNKNFADQRNQMEYLSIILCARKL